MKSWCFVASWEQSEKFHTPLSHPHHMLAEPGAPEQLQGKGPASHGGLRPALVGGLIWKQLLLLELQRITLNIP